MYPIFLIWDFLRKSSPTCHIQEKVIGLAPSDKLIMANKLPSTNLERFLIRIKFPRTH